MPDVANRMEELLAAARAADAEVARARAGAVPAGDADPYRSAADEHEAGGPDGETDLRDTGDHGRSVG